MLLVVYLDVIGCEDCKTRLVCFDPSFVSQMSLGLLLVKLVGLSIVCMSCYCRQQVVCRVQVAVGNGSVTLVDLSGLWPGGNYVGQYCPLLALKHTRYVFTNFIAECYAAHHITYNTQISIVATLRS